MDIRTYGDGVIFEFDSIGDLKDFDEAFIYNIDSEIFDNICEVLNCKRGDLNHVEHLKGGLTNYSFTFIVNETKYVYRHPGPGTEKIIDRKSEVASQRIAKDLGIDSTYIFQDDEKGWKISLFLEGCTELDYHNNHHVNLAFDQLKKQKNLRRKMLKQKHYLLVNSASC